MVILGIWHILLVKSRPSLKEAKGSLRQGCCSDVTSEGSRRQVSDRRETPKAWVDVQVCPVPKGRGQADLRRGKTGTSPQHRIKSYILHMVELRISDDRALKVAEITPGDLPYRPGASRARQID